MDALDAYLAQHADRFVAELSDLLRIPSVSGDPAFRYEVRRAAEFVRDRLREAGCDVDLVETAGHPIVLGRSPSVEGAPTVLVYGHYDVQPAVKEDGWASEPFEPVVRDGAIYARGATDDKGQFYTHLKSVEAWIRTAGRPPVNITFLIEGEEEVGSSSLHGLLATDPAMFACDVVVISDTSQYAPGIPAITYGLRGIVSVEVRVSRPGSHDLHSGMFGGSIANPATALARMLAALHDDAGRVRIPGFYDQVVPLTPEERAEFARLPFDEEGYLSETGVDAAWGEEGFTTLERRWARPTCEVNGLTGGYIGAGPKTIVPSSASAKITCRTVPGQDPAAIADSLEGFLRRHCLPGLQVDFTHYHASSAVLFDRHSPFMDAAVQAVASAFGARPVLIREGGSIPIALDFKEKLGVDCLLLGWGQDTDNLHGPDEHFSLADFRAGTKASTRLWELLSAG